MKSPVVAAACVLLLGGCQTIHPSKLGADANPPPLELKHVADSLQHRELAAALIAKSDQRCDDYLAGIAIQRNVGSGGLSVFGSALTTIGTVTGSGRAANAFAGAGTWVNSSARTFEETVFQRTDFPIIYDAVKRGRTVERNGYLQNMKQFDGLGRHEVLSRIKPYDLNCGITYGLVELSRAVKEASRRTPDLQPPPGPGATPASATATLAADGGLPPP